MPSSTLAEPNRWENKDTDAWFGPGSLAAESTSFFDLNFSYEQDVFDSSDASVEFNFFEDIDIGSTSTDASVFSSSFIGPSDSIHRSFHDSSPRPVEVEAAASAPQSQKLLYRLRPEGIAISNADLLSIEGRNQLLSRNIAPPKTPPATPQHRSAIQTPKTPRTARERGSRIQKASMSNFKKTMHPSNYYSSPDTPSIREWNERLHRISLQQGGELPLSPPSSARVHQSKHPQNSHAQQYDSSILDSPTPKPALRARRNSNSSFYQYGQSVHQSIENETPVMSPLTLWPEVTPDVSFSAVSPLLAEGTWDANSSAHLQNSNFDAYVEDDNDFSISQSFGTSGLFIDFGTDHSLDQPQTTAISGQYDLEQAITTITAAPTRASQTPVYQHRQTSSRDFLNSHPLTSRTSTPSLKRNTASRQHKRAVGSNNSHTSSSSHRRANSSGKVGVSKISTSGGKAGGRGGVYSSTPGDMFVNYTPSDSRRILTGVAPSGSSKTKARREKEAREERRRMSEAARRAVMEAGGNWDTVGELVEV